MSEIVATIQCTDDERRELRQAMKYRIKRLYSQADKGFVPEPGQVDRNKQGIEILQRLLARLPGPEGADDLDPVPTGRKEAEVYYTGGYRR